MARQEAQTMTVCALPISVEQRQQIALIAMRTGWPSLWDILEEAWHKNIINLSQLRELEVQFGEFELEWLFQ